MASQLQRFKYIIVKSHEETAFRQEFGLIAQ